LHTAGYVFGKLNKRFRLVTLQNTQIKVYNYTSVWL